MGQQRDTTTSILEASLASLVLGTLVHGLFNWNVFP